MIDLDDVGEICRADPSDMLRYILSLPDQIRQAWRQTQEFSPPTHFSEARAVVVLGMGGSAIGGDLVRTLVSPYIKLPMLVVRDYDVPAFVGPTTLVIASSLSGETEETLAALATAQERGAMAMAIGSGGTLLQRAQDTGIPVLRFAFGGVPRAALGYSTALITGVLCRCGLIPDQDAAVAESINLLDAMNNDLGPTAPESDNEAKELARFLYGKLPVIFAGSLVEVARRWKGQINENTKCWAYFEGLPELNHNAVAGMENPAYLREIVAVVTLTSSLDHQRVRVRQQMTDELLSSAGIAHRVVAARGNSPLAQIMSAVCLGDFFSYYLALLYGVDPTTIAAVNGLKARLSQSAENGQLGV